MSRRKKTKRKRSSVQVFAFLVLAAVIVGIVGLVFSSSPQGSTQVSQTATSRTFAPDFALTDVNGNTFRLSDQHGKVVVLEFMRTTCPHCANEMSQLITLHSQLGSDVTMISVSVDPQGDTTEILNAYAVQHGAQWVWARDTAGVASSYQVSAVPTIVIIDPDGRIVQTNVGETPASTLIHEIQAAQA
jgi:cytochrome oxidase Cu insertion factor (SCO1/SenC/PrrC family)